MAERAIRITRDPYQSSESGRFEIWVQAFPVASSKWQVSQNGGAQVRWSPDGKRLFYMALDGRLHVVDLRASRSKRPSSDCHAVRRDAISMAPKWHLRR